MGSEVSHVCSQSNFPLHNVLLLGHVQTVLQTPAQQHIPGQHTLWVGQENIGASLLPAHGDMRADKEAVLELMIFHRSMASDLLLSG